MTVTLTEGRKAILVEECTKLYNKSHDSIRHVARVIGLMVASFSAVELGHMFYRDLERKKISALKLVNNNFDSSMAITDIMKKDLIWWINNVRAQSRAIYHGKIDMIITCDASLQGWGAVISDLEFEGRWSDSEKLHHINYLEMLACWFALKSCKGLKSKHVKLLTDNTTAVYYINNMGG
ncbi:hypothetical protein SNE40_014338 [Patella caerulea]|uniref:RNase H type-1 domain-containing protein n=1 Tax=Patella caerulea TaxID=87958 RepID=A0AAN8JDB0_PATCE